jgi:putative drug exporter of the RND superfamily
VVDPNTNVDENGIPIHPSKSTMRSLGSAVYRLRWGVLILWIAAAVALGFANRQYGGEFADSFNIPGSESAEAIERLQTRFPSEADSTVILVLAARSGRLDDRKVLNEIDALIEELETVPQVNSVVSPLANPAFVSQDGAVGLASIRMDGIETEIRIANVEELARVVSDSQSSLLQAELSGRLIRDLEREGPGESEIVGLIAAAIVLLIAFGSLVAMGLPLFTALAGLVTGFSIIGLAAAFLDMASMAPSFAAMLGIGVGIDYALFVVSRFRESLSAGRSVEEAVVKSVETAGQAVLFAGVVVVISLLGLFTVGIPFVANLGLAAAIVVALAMLIAITLLPALLGILGPRVDSLSIRFGEHDPKPVEEGRWYRFSRAIQRFPMVSLTLAVALLLAIASPLLFIELGVSDEGNNPTSSTSRRAYDLLATGFGPGFNGQLLIVIETLNGQLDGDLLLRVTKAVGAVPNVAATTPPRLNEASDTAVFTAIPLAAPQDGATRDLVDHLRDDTFPSLFARTPESAEAFVTGSTAAFIDVSERIDARLVPFFGVVIGLSFLLLMVAFRSIVVPLKAAVLNLVAIGSATGVAVAVFQWGWGAELLGIQKTGPIESFLPMFIFAILFGLSMDYEVFLVSRIRERYLERGDPSDAIAYGVSTSGKVISAAAAILVFVFLSFVLGDQRIIKEFGFTLAVAILIDATIVRLIMVPAAMEIFGHASWWIPGWLDRLLPLMELEESEERRSFVPPVSDSPRSMESQTLEPQVGGTSDG